MSDHAPSNIPVTTMNAILDKKAPLGLDFDWPPTVWVATGPRGVFGAKAGGEYFVLCALSETDAVSAIDIVTRRLNAAPMVLDRLILIGVRDLIEELKRDIAEGENVAGLIVVDAEGREIDRRYVQP